MSHHRRGWLPAVVTLSCALPAWGQQNPTDQTVLEEIHVYGEPGQTGTATKLNLTVFETPQTVTAISRVQMDDFVLNKVNDLLDYAPGLTVEEVETNRTYYTARGFDVVNFQYDGVGVPFIDGINIGAHDTAIYEKVEIVKGAAGLITGLANPSATINYIRKRPTENLKINSNLSMNEWDGLRVDGDISGSLSSSVRGRLVLAKEDTESYLDRNERDTKLGYGIIEADLTDQTLLTISHSYDNSRTDGALSGALPLRYTDGSRTNYSPSTSTAPEWAYADNSQKQTFVELKQQLAENWGLSGTYTRNVRDFDAEWLYVYGTPVRGTELGLNGWASKYIVKEEQDNYDLFISGHFSLLGREHDLVVGYSHSSTDIDEASIYDNTNGFPVLGSDWSRGNTPRPNFVDFNPATQSTDIKLTQKAFYLSSRLNLSDDLSMLIGARKADLTQKGRSYGAPSNTKADKVVPYYGVTYQLSDDLMLYGSYSEVFKQQVFVNRQLQPLGHTEGESKELGLKHSFNDGLAVLTLALFQSEHNNLGEYVGRHASTGTNLYDAKNFENDGFEVEFSGELLDGLNMAASFTKVDLEDSNGQATRLYVPTKQAKLSASYRLPTLPALKVGGLYHWQDDISTNDSAIRQDSYGLLDLMISYEINPNVNIALNIENVTNKKHLQSLAWTQSYYGAPRNVTASISWAY